MRALLLLLAAGMAARAGAEHRAAQSSDVVEAVFTSLYSDHDDARLARELHGMHMVEQLEPRVVAYLSGQGVGPEATERLRKMAQDSAGLARPAVPPIAIQPAPLGEERRALLDHLAHYARNYVSNLPNFICRQVTRRYTNASGRAGYLATLRYSDTLTSNVSFFGGVEQGYLGSNRLDKLRRVEARTGNSVSIGEFGGDMAMIFGWDVAAAVNFDHWEMFRGRRRAVLRYSLGLPLSKFGLDFCCLALPGLPESRQTYTSAIRGVVYADPESGLIARLTIQAIDLPRDFAIQESQTIIDYGSVTIDGHSYTLPVEAILYIRTEVQKNRNEIAFTKYRKFDPASVMTSVDSTITYDKEVKK